MTDRGEYRGIRACLINGPDWQKLSPQAKLIFFTLKLMCGQAGIAVIPALFPTLEETTGLDYEDVGGGISQLLRDGWIKHEGNIVWIIDGLKHEPGYFAGNPNHQKHLRKYLDSLPHLAIVEQFREHYSYLPGLSGTTSSKAKPAKKTTETTGEPLPAKKSETWVQEGVAWWTETVGKMSYPRFGHALKEYVDKYGWDRVKVALMAYTVEMQAAGKPVRVEWFAAEAASRLNSRLARRTSHVPAWEREQHDLGIAKQPQVIAELKSYKESLNGKGDEWWKEMRAEAKLANRHPVAFAHEWLRSQS